MNRFDRRNNQRHCSRDLVKNNKPSCDKIDISTEMFPALSSNTPPTSNISINIFKPMSNSFWSKEPVKDDDGSDEVNANVITNTDLNNTKYYRGAQWTGPVMIRGNIKSFDSVQPSTNRSRIEYSRDNIHWYSSWEKTFSEAHIERRQMEKEQEEYEKIYRIMDEYANIIEEESARYYHEVGELDDYAKAVFARNEYEAYAKQFDLPDEIESIENNENNEYDDEEGNLEVY
jgi:hypothetical protein